MGYCLDCRRPVCSHCLLLGDHKSHQQTPIDQAFETGKETLRAWVEKLSHRVASAENLMEELRIVGHDVDQGAEGQRLAINTEMDQLREVVETKRHQLLSRSALEEQQKRVQLQAQIDRAETARHDASNLVSRSHSLMAYDSEHAFLAVVLPLIQDMKKCSGQAVEVYPSVSTAFRQLSTDAQARSLGDLDLGHNRVQPPPSAASSVVATSVSPAAVAVVSGLPASVVVDGMQHSMQSSTYSVAPFNVVGAGPNHSPVSPVQTHMYSQPQSMQAFTYSQAQQPVQASQVQHRYRPS